jgi:hypothetical protein
MSSEQNYDYSYTQFLEESVPSLDLFNGIVGTATAVSSSYAVPEENLANFQLGESFLTNQYTLDPGQFQQADHSTSLPQLGETTISWRK